MAKPKIAIIIGTTREGRFGEKPAHWFFDIAKARGTAEYELIDLRDYPLPFFNEPASPVYAPPKNEIAERLAKKIGEFDGYVFVTGEYNHGAPAVLKNALDYVYAPFNRKAVAFVGYGGVGAARAVEHLRLVAIELQAAPVRNAVHIGLAEFLGVLQQGKAFGDFPHLGQSATATLDDLEWWANALKTAREANQAASS
jgi:NAD(P)H-dependent FMN reductase